MGLSVEEQRDKARKARTLRNLGLKEKGIIKSKKKKPNRKKVKLNNFKLPNESHSLMIEDWFNKGIYFLFNEGKLVYIGCSDSDVMSRISSHKKDKGKNFDAVKVHIYKEMDSEKLFELEKELIKRHKPAYNKVHNYENSMSQGKFRIQYGMKRT